MTDAWCHGPPCNNAGERRPQHMLPDPYWVGWKFVRVPGEGVLCPGCLARDNPHAKGPHTRIIEEWEHEFGALCWVVVGPLLYPRDDRGVTVDAAVLARWQEQGPDVAAVVPGAPSPSRTIYATNPNTGMNTIGVQLVADVRSRAALAMLDAERVALEWSPPVDEEAA